MEKEKGRSIVSGELIPYVKPRRLTSDTSCRTDPARLLPGCSESYQRGPESNFPSPERNRERNNDCGKMNQTRYE